MENKGCCMPAESCSTEKTKTCESKGSCRVVYGSILGGIVMFSYFVASWVLYPWHKTALLSFTDKKAGASPVSDNPKIQELIINRAHDAETPFAFDSVFKGGLDMKNLTPALVQEFLLCLFAAAVLTCILKSSAGGRPVYLSMKVGIFAGLIHYVPDLIWYHFPLDYTLIGIADSILSATIAGAFISVFILKNGGSAAKAACH